MKKLFIALMFMFITGIFGLCAEAQPEVQTPVPEVHTSSSEQGQLYGAMAVETMHTFTPEEMLTYALEDERMAFAEYTLIMQKFDVSQPFSLIIEAEKKHESLLLDLFKKYQFDVPSFDGSDHVMVPSSLQDTYQVGVEAEIKNIDMYNKFLSYNLDEDMREVFTELRDGSLNHLEAFKRQADKY